MQTGHNGGPPLEDEAPDVLAWRSYTWRRAHKRAWKTPPPDKNATWCARN